MASAIKQIERDPRLGGTAGAAAATHSTRSSWPQQLGGSPVLCARPGCALSSAFAQPQYLMLAVQCCCDRNLLLIATVPAGQCISAAHSTCLLSCSKCQGDQVEASPKSAHTWPRAYREGSQPVPCCHATACSDAARRCRPTSLPDSEPAERHAGPALCAEGLIDWSGHERVSNSAKLHEGRPHMDSSRRRSTLVSGGSGTPRIAGVCTCIW